jgi:hypothetical protein
MSVYSLDEEDRKDVESIFANLDKLAVVEDYKKALSDVTDRACDELASYLEDEYILRFEEIVMRKAKKIVEGLLRGEDLAQFGLKADTNLRGEIVSYDFEKVRKTIVEQFKEEIQHAEMLHLMEENKRLAKDLEYYKQRDRDRY